MKNKEEFKKLIENVKNRAKERGEKLRNEDIASRMGISRTYLSDLLGTPGKDVTPKHIEDFKAHFRNELSGAYIPQIDDRLNPERALMIAMIEDYIEWKAAVTGVPAEKVKSALEKRSSEALGRLHFWLPGEK